MNTFHSFSDDQPLLDHVQAQLAPFSGAPLCVAFSGGLDSTVLLHLLVTLKATRVADLKLRALHVHHGLSPFADQWAQACRQRCQHWQVPCTVRRVRIDSRAHGVEAAAREARYQAIQAALQPEEVVLTAQHQDDQCETVLLALKRGSGPAGLAAMAAQRRLGAHRILRPLLCFTRAALAQYAQRHGLQWVEDESNGNCRFERNFLRQTILPRLTARWPHFAAAAARSAELCAEQEQLLDELLQPLLQQLLREDGALYWPPLQTMSAVKRAALLRRWIAARQGSMPSRAALQRIWQEVVCSREDATPSLKLGNACVRRYRQHLYWLEKRADIGDHVLDWVDWRRALMLPDALGAVTLMPQPDGPIRAPRAEEPVSVRFHASGEVRLAEKPAAKPLKKIWQAFGIPPWWRRRIPLLYYGDQLIAAAGLFVTLAGRSQDGAGYAFHWQNAPQDARILLAQTCCQDRKA